MIAAGHTSSGCDGGQPVLTLVLLLTGMSCIIRHLAAMETTPAPVVVDEEEDDDSVFNRKKTVSSGSVQLSEYLCSSQTDFSMIRTWPCLARLFVKTNTALPASAACECLFSAAGRIFVPNRARNSDAQFEHQLLLKLNRDFVK